MLDDTATQQNTDVSVNKVTNDISNTQEIDEENVKFRVVKGFEKGNRILESATYLVGGSQSSSGKTKESFSIEKKRIT